MTNSEKLAVSIEDLYKEWGKLRERVAALEAMVQPPSATTNTASTQCKCVVKRTEVQGMGIIYSQRECPIHGHLHSAHC